MTNATHKLIKGYDMKGLIAIAITAFALHGCGGDLGEGKHYIGPGKILTITNCNDAGPNWQCSVSVKWNNGSISYGATHDQLSIGQPVYRACWVDDGGRSCFLHFSSRIRRGFGGHQSLNYSSPIPELD